MGFSLALIFVSAVIVSSSGFAIANGKPFCPPPGQLYPCECSSSLPNGTVICEYIANEDVIRDVFTRNQDWNLEEIRFDECTFSYIPSSIVETTRFQILTVKSTNLVSLFDAVPVKTPEIYVNLLEVKISRGIQWKFFSNFSLQELRVRNVDVPIIGNSFKKHMPEEVRVLRFQNTNTAEIKNRAFQRLVNVHMLTLTGGSLKKLSRDMFPRPWNIHWLSFADQKLTALPEDFFADLPILGFFDADGNQFTTLSEKVFTVNGISYWFHDNPIICDCRVKWITTSGEDSNKRFYGKCALPYNLMYKDLRTLNKSDFFYCR